MVGASKGGGWGVLRCDILLDVGGKLGLGEFGFWGLRV